MIVAVRVQHYARQVCSPYVNRARRAPQRRARCRPYRICRKVRPPRAPVASRSSLPSSPLPRFPSSTPDDTAACPTGRGDFPCRRPAKGRKDALAARRARPVARIMLLESVSAPAATPLRDAGVVAFGAPAGALAPALAPTEPYIRVPQGGRCAARSLAVPVLSLLPPLPRSPDTVGARPRCAGGYTRGHGRLAEPAGAGGVSGGDG